MRRIATEGGAPLLKKSRWLLLKREENLKTEQRFRLRDLLCYNLRPCVLKGSLELALYHSLGKLPEPESTHDFF
jgi:hypothetical protein